MNKNMLGAFGAIAVLAGAALAFQLSGSANPVKDNLVAQRLEGRWMLDADITARLDPQRGFQPPRAFEFTKDDVVMKKLVSEYPRFQSLPIHLGGTAFQGTEKHWFVLYSEDGNNNLVLFTPTREGPLGEPHYLNVNMALSRDATKDLLFVGGDVPRESAAAYGRMIK